KEGITYMDAERHLLLERETARVSPGLALSIAERFVRERISEDKLPLRFRKLERVHRRLVYQFETQPIEGYNGLYHLGPVNFKVERLILDVDARTGEVLVANGCGAAPGQLLARYDLSEFGPDDRYRDVTLVSNNTNFIARDTGNAVRVDGRIDEDEWKDTGHRFFYLGDFRPHEGKAPHEKRQYYAEVWTQLSGDTLYFAVKTDTPYWVGLMFKGDANLGMLGAYRDAKVLTSYGTVTDRHFTQRPDKTFFLALDEQDDVLEKGVRQGGFYTYELAFPLDSGDELDIPFERDRAYNMLLAVGNTLEHHGIFTMDDSHKNHDHSKNNEHHVDVWASAETTFRIGSPAREDVFGAPVEPSFSSYVSGFDPSKSGAHFHYAMEGFKDFAGRSTAAFAAALLAALGVLGATFFGLRRLRTPASGGPGAGGVDLFRFGWVRRFAMWRHFRTVFIVPTLLIFIAIVVLGFMDVQDGRRNIATVYTWTLWWSLVVFSLVLMGRFWCMMCPFAAIGDIAQRMFSLDRKLPRKLRNMGFQALAFVALTLAYTIIAFDSKPLVTSIVIIVILAAAVVFSVIYRRRSFCRHLCPIGAVIGLYSTLSPVEIKPRSQSRCDAHAKKTCEAACPMLEAPQDKENNIYCNFCMKCLPACPSANLSLRLRPLGSDLYARRTRTTSEAVASVLLLGVIVVETLSMTSVWEPLKAWVGSLAGLDSQAAAYTATFALTVALPVLGFALACWGLSAWLGKRDYPVRDLVVDFAFIYIPLGVSLHLAHNLQHLFMEGPVAVPATIRLLQEAGVGASWFVNWNPQALFGAKALFALQMAIVGAGLGVTLYSLHQVLRRLGAPLGSLYKMASVAALYALVVILSNIYLLGLPMSGRHVH
ncbi:MAG: 4Fe-4S binding protein, partial [Nitrospirota bacterium]